MKTSEQSIENGMPVSAQEIITAIEKQKQEVIASLSYWAPTIKRLRYLIA